MLARFFVCRVQVVVTLQHGALSICGQYGTDRRRSIGRTTRASPPMQADRGDVTAAIHSCADSRIGA